MADADAQALADFDETVNLVDDIYDVLAEVQVAKQAFTLKDLAVNGEDLASLGIPRDKTMGAILKILLDLVIEKPELNNREGLLETVKSTRALPL